MSVFDFLKQNSFSPFPERHIQDFARSLLKSVACECRSGFQTSTDLFLVLHKLRLVHTDLKPENILLVSNESSLSGPRVGWSFCCPRHVADKIEAGEEFQGKINPA